MTQKRATLEGAFVDVMKNIQYRTIGVHISTDNARLEFHRVETERHTEVEEPSMTLSYKQAEELMTLLWHEGIRPNQGPIEDLKNQTITHLEERIEKYKAVVKAAIDAS